MTKDEAISILEHRLDYWKRISNEEGVGVPIDNDIEALNMAVEALKQSEQKWILCSERLPEPLQAVLVTSTKGHMYISYIVHGEFEYGGDVIAWMPLPKPYEESKE